MGAMGFGERRVELCRRAHLDFIGVDEIVVVVVIRTSMVVASGMLRGRHSGENRDDKGRTLPHEEVGLNGTSLRNRSPSRLDHKSHFDAEFAMGVHLPRR